MSFVDEADSKLIEFFVSMDAPDALEFVTGGE